MFRFPSPGGKLWCFTGRNGGVGFPKDSYWITSWELCHLLTLTLEETSETWEETLLLTLFFCFLLKHQRSWLYWNDPYCQPSIGLKRTKGFGGFPSEILLRWNCQVCYEHDAHGTDLNFRPATNLAQKISECFWVVIVAASLDSPSMIWQWIIWPYFPDIDSEIKVEADCLIDLNWISICQQGESCDWQGRSRSIPTQHEQSLGLRWGRLLIGWRSPVKHNHIFWIYPPPSNCQIKVYM